MMQEQLAFSPDSRTVLYGVFGDPIAHSKSPLMLNRAFRETGLNAAYAAFHVRPEGLRDAVNGIRALGFRGVNITIPHKVKVMEYLDAIDDRAADIGAVNTIVNENGRLVGYNTDGVGYVRSLKEETGINLAGRKILIIGAGGAARAIACALAAEQPDRIVIANRTKERADLLAADIRRHVPCAGHSLEEVKTLIGEMELVVNTTSVGMAPHVDQLPIPPEWLHERLLVSDLIYNPLTTRLLKEAKARGARIHGGLGMFVYQGAYAFEYWTGLPAPIRAMREAVEQSLARTETP